MKRKLLFVIFICLAGLLSYTVFLAVAQTESGTENFAIVSGKWERGQPEKIHLYMMENGALKELASSTVAGDSTFAVVCKPDKQGDFFYIGKNQTQEDRYAFFLKPGDMLNLTVNDSACLLNGKSSPENTAMTLWREFVREMEAKSVYNMRNRSTYADFFPLLEQKLKDLQNYPKSKTGNSAFDNGFEKYRNINLLDIAVSYLFKPRTVHPKPEDFPDYYRNLNIADFTTTAYLLQYPDGIGLIDKVLMAKKIWIEKSAVNSNDGFMSEIGAVRNDTVKGEFALQYALRQKTYIGLSDFEEKYGKYLITENQKIRLRNRKNTLTQLKENMPAIDFAFPDITGKEISLSSFKGKAVYIDFWATWCGPCNREIPFLQKLEADYHGKDVVFLSVSIDASKDREKWKDFVKSKGLKGVQLFAGNEGNRELSKAYRISGIPRFVLVGKDGGIANIDAPRPSSPEIRPLLDSMLKN
ncbi:MAG: redoxin family protein [Prevotellaceae bacterium]|jgi:thiol-disulfide isomerase/thioredoxin|nr:redoxin family protein [Prevotellaceae bacterium]